VSSASLVDGAAAYSKYLQRFVIRGGRLEMPIAKTFVVGCCRAGPFVFLGERFSCESLWRSGGSPSSMVTHKLEVG